MLLSKAKPTMTILKRISNSKNSLLSFKRKMTSKKTAAFFAN